MERTKETILEVAANLFLTKGYEQTRISDIIGGLDGLTKGAIYHYFKSKEDIFEAVVKEIGLQNKITFDKIKFSKDITGSEKITQLVSLSLANGNMETITTISPKLLDNPKLLASFLEQIQEITIPEYFYPIITEGTQDGSIRTENPQQLAELIAVLLNIWLNPLIFENSKSTIVSKIDMLNKCLESFNIKFNIDM
ncbi:TetR/AcrR family transcriptional regulator [Streptococcus pluranimalium]|uniref:TetR/AcrR family transcriptional regulator n=1 Tax=Streptococcus pluranimalium TaxID=82348 RepID=UPI003F691906